MKEIYELYYDELVYFGLKIVRDKQVVEDIVIDSFLKVHGTIHDNINIKRTLYFTVRNKCLNYLRSIRQRGEVIISFFDEEYMDREMIESGVIKGLLKAVEELPPIDKSIIEMYYFDEMSCVEIGLELNKPSATVRSLKRYAIERLFKTIKI